MAKVKWLFALAGFLIQYTILPMLGGITVYPDVLLAVVCVLGLVYGPGIGLLYGLCAGVLAGSAFTTSLMRMVLCYTLAGGLCGVFSFKTRGSRCMLPLILVFLCQTIRQTADILLNILRGSMISFSSVLGSVLVSSLLTALIALPLYCLMRYKQYCYHVIGKRTCSF